MSIKTAGPSDTPGLALLPVDKQRAPETDEALTPTCRRAAPIRVQRFAAVPAETTCIENDRADYARFLRAYGFSEAFVRLVVEDMRDHIDMPEGYEHLTVEPSAIQGNGVFSSRPIALGERVGPCRIGVRRTVLGRRMNHAAQPNCIFVQAPGAGLDVVAAAAIAAGEELTVSYWQAGQVNGNPAPERNAA